MRVYTLGLAVWPSVLSVGLSVLLCVSLCLCLCLCLSICLSVSLLSAFIYYPSFRYVLHFLFPSVFAMFHLSDFLFVCLFVLFVLGVCAFFSCVLNRRGVHETHLSGLIYLEDRRRGKCQCQLRSSFCLTGNIADDASSAFIREGT